MDLTVSCPVGDCADDLYVTDVTLESDYSVGLIGNFEWSDIISDCGHTDYDAYSPTAQQAFTDALAHEYNEAYSEPPIYERDY